MATWQRQFLEAGREDLARGDTTKTETTKRE
jgi:hypothetical protein